MLVPKGSTACRWRDHDWAPILYLVVGVSRVFKIFKCNRCKALMDRELTQASPRPRWSDPHSVIRRLARAAAEAEEAALLDAINVSLCSSAGRATSWRVENHRTGGFTIYERMQADGKIKLTGVSLP